MTKLFSLVSGDWIKGLMMAVIVPVVLQVYTVIQSGSFNVDWHMLALVAASAFLGYIIKNLGTSTTVTPAPGAPSAPVVVTEKVMGVTLPSVSSVPPPVN